MYAPSGEPSTPNRLPKQRRDSGGDRARPGSSAFAAEPKERSPSRRKIMFVPLPVPFVFQRAAPDLSAWRLKSPLALRSNSGKTCSLLPPTPYPHPPANPTLPAFVTSPPRLGGSVASFLLSFHSFASPGEACPCFPSPPLPQPPRLSPTRLSAGREYSCQLIDPHGDRFLGPLEASVRGR